MPLLRSHARDVLRRLRGHDLALCAAGVAFYAVIGLVPLLLVGTWLSGLVLGADQVRSQVAEAATLVPGVGREALLALGDAGTRLPALWALSALLPAGLYGEGLVRAFARLSPEPVPARALRGRLVAAVAVLLSPALLLTALLAATGLKAALGDGTGPQLLGIYLAFVIAWALASALLAMAYRWLTPARPGRRGLAWAAPAAGSFIAGFGLGFVLLLSFGLELGPAYGGSSDLAAGALAALWLYGLHLFALVGYALALALDPG